MSVSTVDVVICVHNALEDVRRCLAALEQTDYPQERMRLILVDDGSDPPTAGYLAAFTKACPWATLLRREEAAGYTVAANTGVRESEAEFVILLNSDTITPRAWLKKLTAVFALKQDVGLVGPLSNAASWQSIPDRWTGGGDWAINDLPPGLSVEEMDAIVETASDAIAVIPRVPLLNGFCYAIRREVIDAIGGFDEASFPRGFGEEDDYTLRVAEAGFGVALAVSAYVFHAKSKSYGAEARKALSSEGQKQLKRKHTEARLARAVSTMRENPYLDEMRSAVSAALAARVAETDAAFMAGLHQTTGT